MSDAPGLVRLRVVDVVTETADARSLVLTPADENHPGLDYLPGQFLTFRIPAPGSGSLARCYSLSSSPLPGHRSLTVTVKRVPDGRGSVWICESVRAGDVLEALRPAGTFTPRGLDHDLLLVAAGSGITPVMSILESALRVGRAQVTLLYANRDEGSVIFARRLAELERRHPDRLLVQHWLESVQGRPERPRLSRRLAPYVDREAFVCGPGPFMDLVRSCLTDLGVPAPRVHTEEFVSLTGDPFRAPEPVEAPAGGSGSTVEVTLDGDRHTLAWPAGQPLLDVLLTAGLPAPFSCREGACSACACVLLDGEVALAKNEVLDGADLAEGLILACQARPVTETVRVSYDA